MEKARIIHAKYRPNLPVNQRLKYMGEREVFIDATKTNSIEKKAGSSWLKPTLATLAIFGLFKLRNRSWS